MAQIEPSPSALDAVRAWMRLNDALAAFDRHLRAELGVTGGQLAILRILAEDDISLTELKSRLRMHPATLGQIVDRIVKLGLLQARPAETDKRARVLSLTARGRQLLRDAPLAGPVRLRASDDEHASQRLAEAFTEAIQAFGLERWARP